MRIYELGHALINKFVPMEESTKLELQSGALEWYNKNKDELAILKSKNEGISKANSDNADNPEYVAQKLAQPTMKNKIFQLLEQWWMRYLFALAFIFLVPKLKAIINGESSGKEDPEDEEDGEDDFSEFMAYRRFKKSMK